MFDPDRMIWLAAIAAVGSNTELYALWAVNLVAVIMGTVAIVNRGKAVGYLDDAARMDGVGGLGRYWHVGLPLAGPALGVAWILIAMAAVDDLLGPIVENGGVGATDLYAVHESAGGFVIGAGVLGIGMAVVLLVAPLIGALGRGRRG
jgi:ABC-type glycerol-3-phosphate transport system permease component